VPHFAWRRLNEMKTAGVQPRLDVAASVLTRLALGGFPLLLLLALRWRYGKQAFDLATAAMNLSMYLTLLMMASFPLLPPAVVRLAGAAARGESSSSGASDAQLIRDHLQLVRVLVCVGAMLAVTMLAAATDIFPALAASHRDDLRIWFGLFAVYALSQVPLALWMGAAQALGGFRQVFFVTAMPRAVALASVPVLDWLGATAGVTIAIALAMVIGSQIAVGVFARRELKQRAGLLHGGGSARRVLLPNLSAFLLGLLSAGATILPITLMGRYSPENVGVSNIIVGISNALAGLAAAAYFPRSLALGPTLERHGGLAAYCWDIARRVGVLTLPVVLGLTVLGFACDVCKPMLVWTTALVFAGAGLRLSALGTQHAAVYLQRPHLNLISAALEPLVIVATLLALLPALGLLAVGFGFLAGGSVRAATALGLERRMFGGR
jgi:hypothetical protein